MADVAIEVAHYRRDRDQPPRLIARSPGFAEHHFAPLEQILTAFGQRPAGVACPGAVFAQPLADTHVAVVTVRDGEPGDTGWAALEFRVLALTRRDYAGLGGDPFALARRLANEKSTAITASPAAVPALSGPVETIRLPAVPISVRDLESVRAVLQRVKTPIAPTAIQPGADPTLTVENSEGPTLLGGAQILLDGGKLVFVRQRPDAAILEGLWMLLPTTLRPRLWPASFAFCNDLGFDVLVVPKLDEPLAGYTTEEQAGDYPTGSYELALQTAAESGDIRGLENVFLRRSGSDTLRLAIKLLIGACLAVVITRMISAPVDKVPRAAAITGIVGVGDPWTAAAMIELGERVFQRR